MSLKRKQPSVMLRGVYQGRLPMLKGKTAILFELENGSFEAQFDDMALPPEFTHAWQVYGSDCFTQFTFESLMKERDEMLTRIDALAAELDNYKAWLRSSNAVEKSLRDIINELQPRQNY